MPHLTPIREPVTGPWKDKKVKIMYLFVPYVVAINVTVETRVILNQNFRKRPSGPWP